MKPTVVNTCVHCMQSVEPGHEALHVCMKELEHVVGPYDRKGNWMQTFTGRQFWPLDPRPEEIFIEDIAHALSMYCRFGGHCREFYPVGEHSLFVMKIVPARDALHGLLHDAAEAYLGDMINPLKRVMPEYQHAEHAVWLAVCQRFNMSPCLPVSVRMADRIAVMTERRDNCAPPPASWGEGFEDVPPSVATCRLDRHPRVIEHEFLDAFHHLTRK